MNVPWVDWALADWALVDWTWADWIIVGIISLSSLVSIWRGFVKEALSLGIWIAACGISLLFHENFAYLLLDYIPTNSIRKMAAIGVLFASTLVVGAMLNYLISELVRMTGLKGTDRLFGMVFGFMRGAIMVLVMVIFLPPLLGVDQDLWWQESKLIPQFMMLENWSRETGKVVLTFFKEFVA